MPDVLYSVAGWFDHFENNRTRQIQELRYYLCPNNFDSDGYTMLVDCANGAAMLGAWHAILAVASRCEPRGTLVRKTGDPHNGESLSRITRLNAKTLTECLERCASIGWLTTSGERQVPASKTQVGAPKTQVPATPSGQEGDTYIENIENRRDSTNTKTPAGAGTRSGDVVEGVTVGMLAVYARWEQYRKEIKKPITPSSRTQLLRDFVKWGEARAEAAVSYTIGKGWQGLVEPETRTNGKSGGGQPRGFGHNEQGQFKVSLEGLKIV